MFPVKFWSIIISGRKGELLFESLKSKQTNAKKINTDQWCESGKNRRNATDLNHRRRPPNVCYFDKLINHPSLSPCSQPRGTRKISHSDSIIRGKEYKHTPHKKLPLLTICFLVRIICSSSSREKICGIWRVQPEFFAKSHKRERFNAL